MCASPQSPFDGSLSTISVSSSESMVEIKRESGSSSLGTTAPSSEQDSKYRLLYSKSKVYVNPTAYTRDNIPGFVVLVKREAINPTYLLAWIPETLLNERGPTEWDKFVKIEEKATFDEEIDDAVLIDLPISRPESYAFSVPLTSIYSLIVSPPTLSSWHGSIAINLINGTTLPTLHFHDDESKSFTSSHVATSPVIARNPASYPPPPAETSHYAKTSTWGGEDLLARLRAYCHLMRSNLQTNLYLVDPSRADIESHSTQIFDDDAVDNILAGSYANSHSPIPAHRRPRPLSTTSTSPPNPYSNRSSILHRSLQPPSPRTQPPSQARTALLQSFSNITRATRHAAQNILSHPLAKPIMPHLPDPVKSFVNAPGEWSSWVEKSGVGEFESARVYLARWARIVAEEGERARRREAQAIPSSSSSSNLAEETSSLGVFELLHSTSNLPTPKPSRDPTRPVNGYMWEIWFEKDGKPKVRIEEMKREVFRKGINPKGNLRRKIWPFLLNVHEWNATEEERTNRWDEKKAEYHRLKDQWCGLPEVFERPDIIEERHRIDVDCRRTDRSQPLFASVSSPDVDDDDNAVHRRYSTMSPGLVDIGAQSPSNEHVERLAAILLTYNFYEKELGYVQGMSDLCAPIYVVMGGDEEMTFWCFVDVMNRMKQNFLRDQSGMKKQLSTLQELIAMMDPELYRHLEKTDGLNLFFCFRWVLIAFKREFPFDDVLRLWEILWTNYYSNNFLLFVALAVLESHRDMILRYLVEFDEILKYCNELSMTIELDSTLAQAEVLFLSFAQLIADMDHRQADLWPANSSNLRHRRRSVSEAGPQDNNAMPTLPKISENVRELLRAG
ncbi:RabGAP/TBC [Neolentinus lepideus HHB14362 ss-1]|uniref:RabGAP/TBC n=1 Tax=Neolentinus lepideus HHB14362 ss-1 TaxID=1314782 RepID=A0A165T7K7_9AGAM|nr:RabGAP/TBC [Neolentinus lepideus HHB14362 ss-1]